MFTLQGRGRGGAGTTAVTSAQARGEAALGAATTIVGYTSPLSPRHSSLEPVLQSQSLPSSSPEEACYLSLCQGDSAYPGLGPKAMPRVLVLLLPRRSTFQWCQRLRPRHNVGGEAP